MTTLNESESNLHAPPEELCRIEGVAGILFQRDGEILINDMPVDEEQSHRIATLAREMCQGFRKARRVVRQIILSYPCGVLLVRSLDDSQLVLLLMGEADLDRASEAAAAYLAEHTKKRLRLPSLAEASAQGLRLIGKGTAALRLPLR